MIIPSQNNFRHKQHGVAIVTALLLTMLVAVTVTGMVWRQHVTLRRLENAAAGMQMHWIARGGLEWARLVMSGDAQSSSTDHLGEVWAQGLPSTPLQENLLDKNSPHSEKLGELSGRISDLQARFNVARLNGQGKVDPAALIIFERLMQGAGASSGEAKAFAQRFFSANQNNALASGRAWSRIEQLANAPELRPYWPQLESQLTWLPRTTLINLNTASTSVLAAALPTFSDSQVRQLVTLRDQADFRNLTDAMQRLNDTNLTFPNDLLTTNSRYFLVEGDVIFGRLTRHYEWAIERNGRASRVIWQREAS